MSEPTKSESPASASPWRIAVIVGFLSETFAFGILWSTGSLRFTAEQILCTLAGPLAAVTAVPRFQYHSLIANVLFVLGFAALAALPFLHGWYPRRWTLVLSVLAWVVWPWLGFLFTIHHV